MPFVTVPAKPKTINISFEDILNGFSKDFFQENKKQTSTITLYKTSVPDSLLSRIDVPHLLEVLKRFNTKHKDLVDTEDKFTLYESFKIPKRKGGLRQIDSPKPALMNALRELKYMLECEFFATYHTSAFAYVKGRSTVDAVKRHQENKSKWFLKLDFKDFFGSTTLDFVMKQLEMIFPFSEIIPHDISGELRKALSLGFLRGGLPQGTPISPTITNLMMIPIDHAISKEMRESKPYIVYTRYADDLILSSRVSFMFTLVQNKITDILSKAGAPFKIKPEKTRYGSSAGSNWNLGVMLNKDNQITVGQKKKKQLKTMLYCFINDCKDGTPWSISDVQHLAGLISYYKMVEPESIDKIIKAYSEKFDFDINNKIKLLLKK